MAIDADDWLPYGVAQPQPVASLLFAGTIIMPVSGTVQTLVAAVAGKAIRLTRLDLVSHALASPGGVAVFSATGAFLNTTLAARQGKTLVDATPVEFVSGEALQISGGGDWADVVVAVSGEYILQ